MSRDVSSSLHALMERMRSIESFCSFSGIYFHLTYVVVLPTFIVEITLFGLSLFILSRFVLNSSKQVMFV